MAFPRMHACRSTWQDRHGDTLKGLVAAVPLAVGDVLAAALGVQGQFEGEDGVDTVLDLRLPERVVPARAGGDEWAQAVADKLLGGGGEGGRGRRGRGWGGGKRIKILNFPRTYACHGVLELYYVWIWVHM